VLRAIALDEVTAADRCGGKATALGALRRAGLPVPDGFALGHEVFAAGAAIPPELSTDVSAGAAALGRVAVRSSMSTEDAAGGAGAGVFASQLDVAPADVWDAIRAVWASAASPLAEAYARRRGAERIEVGVIVQRHVAGRRVTIYTRPPGAPATDEVWIEADGERRREPRASGDPRVALALAAEAALALDGGADVELIEGDGGELALVQARPIVHPVRAARAAPPPALFAFTRATPGVTWRWDAAHNPSPLSPAQAGLVERVDAAGAAPYRMRVVAGFLYATAGAGAAPDAPADASALTAIVDDALARALAALGAAGAAPSVADAIAAYLAFYRIWAGEAAPPVAAARRAVARDVPPDDPAWRPRGTISELLAAGDREALVAIAPAWDVAAPTLDEQPAWLDAARTAATARAAAPRPPQPLDDRRALAAAVAHLAERDDLAFARAQALVRRALLADAARRGLDPLDDVFWLPLDEVADATSAIDPVRAHARAHGARAAAARAAAWDMPLAVVDGTPAPAPPEAVAGGVLRGTGVGARATGRVAVLSDLIFADGGPPPATLAGAVLVVPAVTPALALFAQSAAAIVADHGGALDHGAALARELGIPYVICRGASRALTPGDVVVIDGDAGTITPVR
jgi:phosphohistidine swiveling domain-containing protein